MAWIPLVYQVVQKRNKPTAGLRNVRPRSQDTCVGQGLMLIENAGQNFRLPPLRTHTLESDTESDSDQALESTAAKLRRLKAELAEVEAEVQAGPSKRPESNLPKRRSVLPPRPLVDMAEELNTFKQRLDAVEGAVVDTREASLKPDEDEWTERLERLRLADSAVGSNQDKPENRQVGTERSTQDGHSVSDLDKRLARLETAFGSDEMTVSQCSIAALP